MDGCTQFLLPIADTGCAAAMGKDPVLAGAHVTLSLHQTRALPPIFSLSLWPILAEKWRRASARCFHSSLTNGAQAAFSSHDEDVIHPRPEV